MTACAACGQENPPIARFCLACGTPLSPVESLGEHRKVVTVLFCDVVGSTALGGRLDSEALRAMLARYFAEMRETIETHGGTVEKFIGDAVMAVFGVPTAHEDDALRAARAAVDMRDALKVLNVELERDFGTSLDLRIGLNTGEVVVGTEERLATGDAINVAKRLEQAAPQGAILIGEATLQLTRHSVEVEPVPPLALKGKPEPVPAWLLVAVSKEVQGRRSSSRLVGRDEELAVLMSSWNRARNRSCCELVTVVGAAGVGKSRLVEEFLVRTEASALRGSCPSYGRGVTYWPVVNVLEQLESRLPELDLEPASREAVTDLLANDGGASTDQIAAAFLNVVDEQADEQAVCLVLDDIQWGEEVFLDLIERLAAGAEGPILVLCVARPELLNRRPGWAGVLQLQPLRIEDAELLMQERLAGREIDTALKQRVVTAAGGNPLFVEEMTAVVIESGDREIAVPPTIQALLGARLDQLDTPERRVLERAAVEGETFHVDLLQTLVPDAARLDALLRALVDKELIRPERSQLSGARAFRFRHLLIRDAAYESLPKAVRAEIHERCAGWLEECSPVPVELDALAGYHLEQAYSYRTELGPPNLLVTSIGERAADHLAAAGLRANTRWDLRAAIALLERASSLLAKDDPRLVALLPELGNALAHAQELDNAEAVLDEAIHVAAAAGDARAEAHALLASLGLQWRRDPEAVSGELVERGLRAVGIFEKLGDDVGLAQAWLVLSNVYRDQFEMTASRAALEAALTHARAAGDTNAESLARINYGLALLSGPAPIDDVERYQQDNLAWAERTGSARVRAAALVLGGRLRAMRGDFVDARRLIAEGRALFEELGIGWAVVAVDNWSSEVEELAGDLPAAERELRDAVQACERTGDKRRLPFAFALARLVDLQGRSDQASELGPIYEETASVHDRSLQVARRLWRARVLVRQEEATAAVPEVEAAAALAPPSDAPLERCRALMDAAAILRQAGRPEAAAPMIAEALSLYERKGNLVAATTARSVLAELQALTR